jgi:predicted nucleotidyltransferase
MPRQFPTGDSRVDDAVDEVTRAVSIVLADRDLGFYLHGSAFAGTRRPESDVDVLGLGRDAVDRADNDRAKRIAAEVSARHGVDLDLKVFPVRTLVADPWVNLWHGAAFVAGRDWRDDLPQPSLDDLAREAVLHTCLIAAPGDNHRPAKALGWLTTTLLAVRHGYAAPTREDALIEFNRREPALATQLRDTSEPIAAQQLLELVRRELMVDAGSSRPRLGPKCHAIVRDRLDL